MTLQNLGRSCTCLETHPKKLEPRSRVCLFVEYPKETRGDLFFDPKHNKVFVSTNATFLEEDHMRQHILRSKVVLNEVSNETIETSTRVVEEAGTSIRVVDETSSSHIHPPQELKEPRCNGRIVNPPTRYLCLTETQDIILDDEMEDPLTYNQAINDVDKDE